MRDAFMKESKIKEEEIGKIIQNEDWWIYEKIRIEEMEIRKRQKALWFKRHEHEEKIGNDIEEEGPLSNSISDWEMVREKEKNHKGSDAEKRICWGGYKDFPLLHSYLQCPTVRLTRGVREWEREEQNKQDRGFCLNM